MRGTGHFEWIINAMDPWTDEWDGLSCRHDSALFLQTESHHKACWREAKAIRHACITTDGSSDWLRSFCMCSSIEFYTLERALSQEGESVSLKTRCERRQGLT